MADHILGVDGPSVTIPTGVLPASGLTLGDFDDNWVSAATHTITPGTVTIAFVLPASPPSWLSGGRIVEPGIYAGGFILTPVSGSSTGHYLAVGSWMNASHAIPLDGVGALSAMNVAHGFGADFGQLGPVDVGAIGTPDVPPAFPVGWNADWTFFIPPAASDWSVQVQPFIQRLAYPA